MATAPQIQKRLARVQLNCICVVSSRGITLIERVLGFGPTQVGIPIARIVLQNRVEIGKRVRQQKRILSADPAEIVSARRGYPYPVSTNAHNRSHEVNANHCPSVIVIGMMNLT